MEPTKFDAFAKAMATSASRRWALKGFVVAALGGGLGLGGLEAISSFAKGHGSKVSNSVNLANLNSSTNTNANSATSASTSTATGGNASATTGAVNVSVGPTAAGQFFVTPSGQVIGPFVCAAGQILPGQQCAPGRDNCCTGTQCRVSPLSGVQGPPICQ